MSKCNKSPHPGGHIHHQQNDVNSHDPAPRIGRDMVKRTAQQMFHLVFDVTCTYPVLNHSTTFYRATLIVPLRVTTSFNTQLLTVQEFSLVKAVISGANSGQAPHSPSRMPVS